MIDPGLSSLGEGIRVAVKHDVILEDQFSGSQMPPHIRISHAARGHGEKAESEDDHKHAPGLQPVLLQCSESYRGLAVSV